MCDISQHQIWYSPDDNDDELVVMEEITVELLCEMGPSSPVPEEALSDAAIHQYLTGSDSVPTG
jgi:hypothetical protein